MMLDLDAGQPLAVPGPDPGVFSDMNVQDSTGPSPQPYSDESPQSHGILGPNSFPESVPPEPSWWTQQEWNVEQWAADKWNNFKQNMKSLGETLADWFWN